MKNLFKNYFGFTLVEVLMSAGIASAIILIIVNSFKENTSQVTQYQQTLEVNTLIQRVTTELSKKEICERNFGKQPSPLPALAPLAIAPTAPQNVASLVTRNGTAFLAVGSTYGGTRDGAGNINTNKNTVQILSMTKQGVTSGVNSRLTKMTIRVGYRLVKSATTSTFGLVNQDLFFNIPVNVFLDANGRVDTCYSDVQSLLENAVRRACLDNEAAGFNGLRTATYIAPNATYPYGRCEHAVELLSNAGAAVAQCPAGEFLQNINTTLGRMTFQCRPFTTTNSCPAWSYIESIDSSGTATCRDIRTLFPNSGFMVIRAGTYAVLNIACAGNEILQRIDAAGNPVCVNPKNSFTCPVNQYVTAINADGSVSCAYSSNRNACAGTTFMTNIDSIGNVTCGSPALMGSCAPPNVVIGINAAGTVICGANQP